MDNIEQQREKALSVLESPYLELYSSSRASKLNRLLITKYHIAENSIDTFLNITGDTILGIESINSIPEKLQTELDMSADESQRVMSDLSDFLSPVIQRERTAGEPDRSGLQELQQNFKSLREEALQAPKENQVPETTPPENLPVATPADTAPNQPPTIHVAPAATKSSYTVEPMRTMVSDVTRIHGYGAYRDLFPDEAGEQTHKEEVIKASPQEALLEQRPTLAEKPNYTE